MKNPLAWRICFEKLLLPLLDALAQLPPPATSSEPGSVPYDPSLKACSLLFQTFLHHLETLLLSPDFAVFWTRLLAAIQRLADAGSQAQQQHVLEALKNALLVLKAAGVWDSVRERTGQDLHDMTLHCIDSFRADWKDELRACLLAGDGGRQAGRDASREAETRQRQERGERNGALTVPAMRVNTRPAVDSGDDLNSPVSISSFLSQQQAEPPTLSRAHSHPDAAQGSLQQQQHVPPVFRPVPATGAPFPTVQPPLPAPHVPYPSAAPVYAAGAGAVPRFVPAFLPGAAPLPTGTVRPIPPPTRDQPYQVGVAPPLPFSALPFASPARPPALQVDPRPSMAANSQPPLPMPKVSPSSASHTNGLHHSANGPVVIRFPARAPPTSGSAVTSPSSAGSGGARVSPAVQRAAGPVPGSHPPSAMPRVSLPYRFPVLPVPLSNAAAAAAVNGHSGSAAGRSSH